MWHRKGKQLSERHPEKIVKNTTEKKKKRTEEPFLAEKKGKKTVPEDDREKKKESHIGTAREKGEKGAWNRGGSEKKVVVLFAGEKKQVAPTRVKGRARDHNARQIVEVEKREEHLFRFSGKTVPTE